MSTLKIFKKDFYERLGGLNFFAGRNVLDVGCGDGEDAYAISKYAKKVVGIDIVRHKNWERLQSRKLKFLVGDAQELPFKNGYFSGLFEKDVLHHVNNPEKALSEIRRVVSKSTKIMLVEGNRYNPLFYVHMTKLGGHEHFSQGKFKEMVLKYFPNASFSHFESHFVPIIGTSILKLIIRLEKFMDRIPFLAPLLSYNAAVVGKHGNEK